MPKIGAGASAIITDPVECCALRIQNGLRLWKGNWALDLNQGFPWGPALSNKSPNLVALSNQLKTAILLLGAPVVVAQPVIAMAFAQATRSLKFAFKATATTGQVIIGGTSGPAGIVFVLVQGT
jgi:hypothetical protein